MNFLKRQYSERWLVGLGVLVSRVTCAGVKAEGLVVYLWVGSFDLTDASGPSVKASSRYYFSELKRLWLVQEGCMPAVK